MSNRDLTAPELLRADGEHVSVDVARRADIEPYRRAMSRSAARIGEWNPVNPGDLVHHLAGQSDKHRTFLIRAHDDVRAPYDTAGLVGCVNVTNVVQGRFMSATMGYNAFDPYVGRGLFREGLGLVVGIALRSTPSGMGLHRVEAHVRTENATSAGVLRSLGFRRERSVRRMLWLTDGTGGTTAWRDHDSYAVTREEWPAPAHAAHDAPSGVLVFEDLPERVLVALARELCGVALSDVPYEAALRTAMSAAAPVLWRAGPDAPRAVADLVAHGAHAVAVEDPVGDGENTRLDAVRRGLDDPATIVRTALSLRHLLT